MAGNTNEALHAAKANKKDEFYTQMKDIEDELVNYRKHFKGKTIFMNCDDPETSNFWKWFETRFESLGVNKLISTHYNMDGSPSYKLELTKECGKVRTPLEGDGDFRSDECVELLKEADIVCTNPPFSLFREYVAQLMEHGKGFLIIGNQNAVTYKEVFPYIKAGKLWLGYGFPGTVGFFSSPYEDVAKSSSHKDGLIRVAGVTWFTNLDHDKLHEPLILYKRYDPDVYPTYDNYDAIEVGKTKDIPRDYEGVMGVPLTFMGKYNPDQFEIIGCTESEGKGFSAGVWDASSGVAQPLVNGERKYKRLFIRNKQPKK